MNLIVAKNIERFRKEYKPGMEEFTKLSGVSRDMLAQIEREEGNPTLPILWKTSNRIKIPLDALTVRPKNPYEIVGKSEIQPLLKDDGKIENYSLSPDGGDRRFTVYYLELDVGNCWESELHLRGAAEFTTVVTGRVEIYASGQRSGVGKDESTQFKADTVHSYRDIGEETAILHMIPSYP